MRWFPANERIYPNVIGNYSVMLGWAFGLLLPSLLLEPETKVNQYNIAV